MVRKPSSPSTFFRRYFPETFPTTFFPDDIFRHRPHHQECKEEICNFSQSTGAKNRSTRCFSLAAWIPHASTWPTFWCRASTSRLVRHHLTLLSLRQSSPNPASPFFWHFSLRESSFSLWRQLPSLAETCVCLGKASSSSPVLFSCVWVQTYQVLLPQLWSNLPLGLSSIQTWFNLRWSGYGD